MAKTKKTNPENPDLLQLGQKARAGQLLSGYLRAIGTEVDQVVTEDTVPGTKPGMPKLVSKAEALARFIWREALPFKDAEGVVHKPDFKYVDLVLNRVEGKASVAEQEKESGRETVPDKVSRMGVDRLNKMAQEAMGE
ncbi:hypothetical protein IMZ48_10600 [Candidatus Bathyarchaeota archaeon]|nr:hypothetical protein [Candidatus Bathyarchaeota archaeon]MBE3118596.1 hypothetical protein [Candidatus Atribacteria bacterium]